jgi:hypothetical protein
MRFGSKMPSRKTSHLTRTEKIGILFLPDSPERQSALDQNKHRFRWGKDSTTRQLIEVQQYAESNVSMQKMSEDVAWNTGLTYEAWEKGQRMPSIITALR